VNSISANKVNSKHLLGNSYFPCVMMLQVSIKACCHSMVEVHVQYFIWPMAASGEHHLALLWHFSDSGTT